MPPRDDVTMPTTMPRNVQDDDPNTIVEMLKTQLQVRRRDGQENFGWDHVKVGMSRT